MAATQHDHEGAREELWTQVWVAVARSTSSTTSNVPTAWADRALADFDKRFAPEVIEKERAKRIAKKKAESKGSEEGQS